MFIPCFSCSGSILHWIELNICHDWNNIIESQNCLISMTTAHFSTSLNHEFTFFKEILFWAAKTSLFGTQCYMLWILWMMQIFKKSTFVWFQICFYFVFRPHHLNYHFILTTYNFFLELFRLVEKKYKTNRAKFYYFQFLIIICVDHYFVLNGTFL